MTNTYFEDDDCQPAPRPAPVAITDNRIARFWEQARPEDGWKGERCIRQQIAAMGYDPNSTREGGRIYERAKIEVARNLIREGMTLGDVEFWDETPETPPKKVRGARAA